MRSPLRLLPLLALAACGEAAVQDGAAPEAAVLAPASLTAPAPPRPNLLSGLQTERMEAVGDGLVLYGVTLPGEAGALTAAELRLEGLRAVSGGIAADRVTGRDLSAERADGARVRLASVTVTNLVIGDGCTEGTRLACASWDLLAATDAEAVSAASRWRADLLTVAEFDRGRAALVRAAGVAGDRPAPGVMPTMPRLIARGLGAPLGLAGLAEADALRADAVRLTDADLSDAVRGGGALAFGALRVTRPTLSRGGQPLSRAASLSLRDVEVAGARLIRAAGSVVGARADLGASLGEGAARAAQAAGLSATRGGAEFTYVREVGGAKLDADWRLAGQGRGRLSLRFADDAATSLAGGRIEVEDQGALDGFFAVAAAAEGQDPLLLRRQVLGALTFVAMQVARDDPEAARAADAVLAFAARGGALEVTLRPDEPVASPALAAAPPAEALRRLGLGATLR